MSDPEKFDWYDYRAIRSRNALWNIVAGPRSIGKTYGKKDEQIRRAIRTRRAFLWLRRNLTELRPAKSGFFDAIADEYPLYRFRVQGDDGQVQMDGETWVTIVKFAALSTAYQLKGTEFPEVDEIVYDECFAEPKENGEPGTYLPDEVEKLRNLWITVNRKRKDRNGQARTKVYLLGNVTAFDNPYFLEFGFTPEREWQRSGVVQLHLVDASKYEQGVEETMYGNALGTIAKDYASGKYFRHDAGLYVDARPADSKPFATLVTMRGTFGLWEAADYSGMYVTPGPLAAPEAPVVAFEPLAVRPGVVLADLQHYIRSNARRHYRRGSMFLVTAAASPARQALAR
jgi:hypothetical protein